MEENANSTLTTAQEQEIRDDPEAMDKYSARIYSHANMHGFTHTELLFDVIHGYKTRCETARRDQSGTARFSEEGVISPRSGGCFPWLTGPGVCDECSERVGTLIGCPNGAEICRNCLYACRSDVVSRIPLL